MPAKAATVQAQVLTIMHRVSPIYSPRESDNGDSAPIINNEPPAFVPHMKSFPILGTAASARQNEYPWSGTNKIDREAVKARI